MKRSFVQQLKALGDDLLRSPDPSDVFISQPRLTASYQSMNERFVLKESGFDRQFAQMYFCRHMHLKTQIEKAAQLKWPTAQYARVLGIQNCSSDEVYICGVLLKNMKLKPRALDKYLSKKGIEKDLQKNKNRVSDDDFIYLEDEGARIELAGSALSVHTLVSGCQSKIIAYIETNALCQGICMAAKGRQVKNGKFEVADVCYPGLAPQKPLAVKLESVQKLVMFVSGINLANINIQSHISLDLLSQYITGAIGTSKQLPTNIARIVVCGNLVGKNEELATSAPNSRLQSRAMGPLLDADKHIQEFARSIPIDVMPGANDPATFFMPQQSFHKCLFPKASEQEYFNRVTNPHDFEIEGVRILGTSGQNISDILLHSDHQRAIDALEACLEYQHLAPTCPDTLTCFPFNMNDPFVVEETPHIFFAGNQPSFETKNLKGNCVDLEKGTHVCLICVPNFSVTSEVVVVNLQTLQAEVMEFGTHVMDI